jgi:phosphatidate cytidylyltransferase
VLRQRLLTAALLIPLTVWGVLALSSAPLAMVLAALVLLGAWEWAGLAGLEGPGARVFFLVLISSGLWAGWQLLAIPVALGAVLGVALLWWVVVIGWLRRHLMGSGRTRRVMVLKALAGVLTLVPAWIALVALHAQPTVGPYLLLLLLLLIWVADTGAYFAGRRWGRTKLAPAISPGKTRAGVYGALLTAGLVAVAGGVLLGLGLGRLLLFVALALVTVVFSVVGDLFESMMKRHSGVKDSGRLLPGHGGVLDRVDSMTAAAPVFLLGVWLLGIRA